MSLTGCGECQEADGQGAAAGVFPQGVRGQPELRDDGGDDARALRPVRRDRRLCDHEGVEVGQVARLRLRHVRGGGHGGRADEEQAAQAGRPRAGDEAGDAARGGGQGGRRDLDQEVVCGRDQGGSERGAFEGVLWQVWQGGGLHCDEG